MEKSELIQLTDEELLLEKKKMKNARILNAGLIGFLFGIFLFGVVGWIKSSKLSFGVLLPLFMLGYFIYKLLKSPNKYEGLKEVLKERNL